MVPVTIMEKGHRYKKVARKGVIVALVDISTNLLVASGDAPFLVMDLDSDKEADEQESGLVHQPKRSYAETTLSKGNEDMIGVFVVVFPLNSPPAQE